MKGASIRAVLDNSLIPIVVFDNKALTSRVSTQEARSESYRGTQRDGTTKSVADADTEFPRARRTHRRSFGMAETIGRMESA